jgi:O-acetyl-ADP-ribose deacetylase (regulator of RNase III)
MKNLQIILADLEPALVQAWHASFDGQEGVSMVQGDITQIACDAVVSPANSFGFMDGGLDYALSVRFGWELEKRLQQQIKALPMGELLVGQALVLETGDDTVPYLVSAPTMRVPTNFNIDTSVNAYLAMKAILLTVLHDKRIKSIVIPGLCTGVGRMLPAIAAQQMFIAYEEVILGKRMDFATFGESQKYQLGINPTGMIWTH